MKIVNLAIKFILIMIVAQSCKINYSLSGASIPVDAKTVSVDYFPNQAPLVQPSLSQKLTDDLKDKFVSQTSLELINGTGDLHFEGEIVDYNTKPIDIQSNETAASNRLTIKIHVIFTNSKDPNFDFDTTFERYEDYSSSQELNQVEEGLIETIVEQIIDDIFNKAVVNW